MWGPCATTSASPKGGDAPLRGHAPAAARSPSTAPQCVAWPHPARRPAAHRPAHGPSTPPGDRPPNRLLARPHQATCRAAAAAPRPVSGLRSTAGRAPRPDPTAAPSALTPVALRAPFTHLDLTMAPTSVDIGFSLHPCPRKPGAPQCTAPGFLDTRLRYASWRSSYCSRASSGVRYASFSRRQHWL